MLIILFGLAGTGKNFIGEILKTHFKYYYWDADEILPDKMRQFISNQKSFTQQMRDEYTENIISKISQLRSEHDNLVVSQAFYKEKNRSEVLAHFPDTLFIFVKADAAIISQRIQIRGNKIDESYAKKIADNFEMPVLSHFTITNNSNASHIIKQLEVLLNLP